MREAMKYGLAMLIPVMVVASLACDGTPEKDITFANETNYALRVTEDGFEMTTLQPGERQAFAVRKSLTPNRIQAYDDGGRLVHDGLLTWDKVAANGFVYIIDETIESPTPTTTS